MEGGGIMGPGLCGPRDGPNKVSPPQCICIYIVIIIIERKKKIHSPAFLPSCLLCCCFSLVNRWCRYYELRKLPSMQCTTAV